jgi:hypothetical protein
VNYAETIEALACFLHKRVRMTSTQGPGAHDATLEGTLTTLGHDPLYEDSVDEHTITLDVRADPLTMMFTTVSESELAGAEWVDTTERSRSLTLEFVDGSSCTLTQLNG